MAGEIVSLGFKDYSDEDASFTVHVGGVTAVSLPGLLSDISDFVAAVDAISIGSISYDSLRAYLTRRVVTLPTNPSAQRERLWRVHYVDNLPFFDDPVNAIPNAGFGKPFWFDIPTADFALANVFPLNSDEADLAQTQIAAFVAAFEAMARSPYGGTVTVTNIFGVGRAT